jgi:alpha-glucuronidase
MALGGAPACNMRLRGMSVAAGRLIYFDFPLVSNEALLIFFAHSLMPGKNLGGTMLRRIFLLSGLFVIVDSLHAETGYEAWLRYTTLEVNALRQYREFTPPILIKLGSSAMQNSAQQELIRGIRKMLGRTLRVESLMSKESAIILGTLAEIRQAAPQLAPSVSLEAEGYYLKIIAVKEVRYIIIAGADDRGALYGAFALLRKIAVGESINKLDEKQAPSAPVRWLNLWDTLGGPVPGAAAGSPMPPGAVGSVLWENGLARKDLSRLADFGRILASVGINGCAISIVNADPRLLDSAFYPEIKRIADVFRPWGVRIVLPVDFGSPKNIGKLETFDPLDPKVMAWWKSKADELYAIIPDIAGFVMKADSEGTLGPSAYKRTHAQATSVIARALKSHNGLLFYRAFVYNHHLDWNVMTNDRARAAYDNFHALDGQFDDNVVIQIKNGPIDFQVREPASPLFSGLEKTNQAIELQVIQEYMGGGRHLVNLVPWWKDTLDFDMRVGNTSTPVKKIITGKLFKRPVGGFVGVTISSMDPTWTRSHFSQANLYGFGRLAWDPDLSSQSILEEWTRLSFGNDPATVRTIVDMNLKSWRVYENYTGPLGLQTLTEITGNHYGVAVEASERNGWGQWHRADEKGVGMDRSVATGTGFIGQFRPEVAKIYESKETCPDDLLLFMHHVPYTHMLHSGKTVIQYLYDSHYEGADSAAGYVRDWKSLAGRVDEQRYREILASLQYQEGAAELWRDAVAGWFHKTSGIPDAKGRVGYYKGRIEAESMKLDGYVAKPVIHFETASGITAVRCPAKQCSAGFQYNGTAGFYTMKVRYFDYAQGRAQFRLIVQSQIVDEWLADDTLPTRRTEPDGTSSTRRMISGVALRPGDQITIQGFVDGGEDAALDYVEVLPETD